MDKLSFPNYLENLKKKRPAPHKRGYWCDLIAQMCNKPITRILGLTSGWPVQWIEQSYLDAKQGKNPPALWWWWYKQTKQEQNDKK